jgi:hypothetical protein
VTFDPISLATELLALGAMWGHLVTKVNSNRKTGDERHKDNVERLEEIRDDVKRINGTVREHNVEIAHLKEHQWKRSTSR